MGLGDGKQALEALDGADYDIVLMDCQMPEMDGLTATRALRAKEAKGGSGHTLVIAVTANAFESDRADCLKAGMDDFLSKPFGLEELEAVLTRWRQYQAGQSSPGR